MPTAVQLAEFQIQLNMAEMTKREGELWTMERRGVKPDSLEYRRVRDRLSIVKAATVGWQNKYFQLTGKRWLHYDMPQWDLADECRKADAAENKAAYAATKQDLRKQAALAYSGRIRECENRLAHLKDIVRSAKNPLLQIPKGATGTQVAGKVAEEVGFGFTENFMVLERIIPWDVETNLIPQIEKNLKDAKSAFQVEKATDRFLETHRALMRAATQINQGMAAMEKYSNAVQRNGKLAIAYIKWTAIAFTSTVSSAYAVANGVQGLTAMQSVGSAMVQKTGEETATLAARLASGEKVTRADVKNAIGEISLAGVTSAASEIAASFAGPVAARLYGKPTKAQIEVVTRVLKNAVANNSEQALKALENVMNGKRVDWNWWASVVAPLLPDDANAVVKDDDIRKPVLGK